MCLLLALLACEPTGAVPPGGSPPSGTTSTTTSPATSPPTAGPALEGPELGPAPTAPCAREADYAEWPGGRALRLELGTLTPGASTAVTVSGAEPGERVVLHVGDLCALDCAPELDGACFQGGDAQVVGEVVAGADGVARAQVAPHESWESRWLVLQATAPDRGDRAISQAVVDRIGDWYEPIPPEGAPRELSPMTLRGQRTEAEEWTWPIAPGRRVRLTYEEGAAGSGINEGSAAVAHDGTILEFARYGEDGWPGVPAEVELPGPSTWYFAVAFDYGEGTYALDIETVPSLAAVDWYPDLDGDGYGDPLGAAVSSTLPVPGASPDGRDCDDADPAIAPHGAEICDDGLDQDCDGLDRACGGVAGTDGTRLWGLPFVSAATELSAGDFDGDGDGELFVTNYGHVFDLGRADQLGPRATFTVPWAGAAVGDLTGDGADDVVLLNGDVAVVPGPWTGSRTEADAVLTVDLASTSGLARIGDITGDGAADLLVVGDAAAGGVAFPFYEGPLATFVDVTDGEIPATGGGLTRVNAALGDADGDGILDVWTHDVCLFLAPVAAAGAAAEGCVDDGIYDNTAWGGMVAVEVDGDGHGDLVVGGPEGAIVLLGPLVGEQSIADGAWGTVLEEGANSFSWQVGATPDRDGDGMAEILLGVHEEVWSVSAAPGVLERGDGAALWTAGADPSLFWRPSVLGGDFDGDGFGDVAIGDQAALREAELWPGVVHVLWGP